MAAAGKSGHDPVIPFLPVIVAREMDGRISCVVVVIRGIGWGSSDKWQRLKIMRLSAIL